VIRTEDIKNKILNRDIRYALHHTHTHTHTHTQDELQILVPKISNLTKHEHVICYVCSNLLAGL